MAADPPQLIVRDAAAWRTWLAENVDEQPGVWLVLAKKGTMDPTSLSYAAALEEALCHGWIDGQARRRDEGTYVQRFTPRRRRSMWSQRNVGIVERLTAEVRMHPRGLSEVARAKADGRWEVAYAGPATAEIPADLTEALAARPEAQAMFENLTSQNRFAVLHRLGAAKRQETRARRIKLYVDMLARGETLYAQRKRSDRG
jgi:uncharacterized protein YdeI (YjbR/CyaY-like superfamily)